MFWEEKRRPEPKLWRKRELALLGKFSDSEVAQRTGRTIMAVRTKRRALQIKRPPRRFTAEDAAKLEKLVHAGKMRDEEIAKALGKGVSTIQMWRGRLGLPCPMSREIKPWTKEELELLGKFSDEEVAQRVNRDVKKVRMKRISLQRTKDPYHHRWSDEDLGLLGKMSDADIADRTGLSISSVRGKRNRLGIPAWMPRPQGSEAA